MLQAVIQDDAEALVWMLKHNLVELEATDDLGNTAAHLAVFHDSPRFVVETRSVPKIPAPTDPASRTREGR